MIAPLLLVLTPIALLDSTSMIPLSIVPLATLLGGRRPFVAAASLLGGVFVVYAGAGLLILLGLDALLGSLAPHLTRWWNDPETPELILQLATGFVLIGFGWRLARAREGIREQEGGVAPLGAFGLGAGLTVAGMPGALPYFGAIDQILRADLPLPTSLLALLFYNLVFVLPLASLVGVRVLLPGESERIYARVRSVSERWGRRLIVGMLLVVGAVLGADAIGWFLGHPLLPVQPR